jgi:hypothetical protein
MATANKVFKFYADPGHAWLAVKIKDLMAIRMSPNDFSPYSYIRGGTVYLEEDCDASLFAENWKAKFGSFNYESKHTDKTHPIRSYNRIK